MKIAIDASGRLVIPREIRRQAGIQPGMPLEIRCQDGRIEIEPAVASLRLVRQGRFLVAVPEIDGETLTAETVEGIRQTLSDQRGLPE